MDQRRSSMDHVDPAAERQPVAQAAFMLLVGLPPQNELEVFGNQVRERAYLDPCLTPTDGLDPKFYQLIGFKFHVGLVLELYDVRDEKMPPAPRWHCSVSILHDIASGTDQTFGMGEQAILNPDLWNTDDYKDARDIMGYALGPVIVEETQPVIERKGLWAYHWSTPADKKYARAS